MLEIENNKISIVDEYNQIFEFMADENGDYYFMLYSPLKDKSEGYCSFLIANNHPSYNGFKQFIEQEISYMMSDKCNALLQNSYFVINNNSVRIADQNRPIADSEFVEFTLLENGISIIFSKRFPASIRVTGVGRMDFYPFFIPVIDLLNNMQDDISKKRIYKK